MPIDRRVLSILYHNDIKDANKIEKFIGQNEKYYEVVMNGEIVKLKIPGVVYDDVVDVNSLKKNLIDKVEKTIELSKDLKKPETEEQQKIIDEIYDEIEDMKEILDSVPEQKNENILKTDIVEKVEKAIEKKPKIVKTSVKKEEVNKTVDKKQTKKTPKENNDDFINSI